MSRGVVLVAIGLLLSVLLAGVVLATPVAEAGSNGGATAEAGTTVAIEAAPVAVEWSRATIDAGASRANAVQTGNGAGNVTRDGDDLVLSVEADSIEGAGNETTLAVAVPAANGSASVTATREDGRYVARFAVTEVVPPSAAGDLAAAQVQATHDGSTVADASVDLRYVAQTGPATFQNTTLVVPADVRGLGDAVPSLDSAENGSPIATSVDGIGPNATLRIAPDELAGIAVNGTHATTVAIEGEPIAGSSIEFSIVDAARRATSLEYVDDEAVVTQPLAHPTIGPDRIQLTVATDGPRGIYHVGGADESGRVSIPAVVLGAASHRVTVEGDGDVLLSDVGVSVPGRPSIRLRIANGSLHAPDPGAITGYDAVLLRDENVSYVPLESRLVTGAPQPLPPEIAQPGQGATALLVGDGVRPARVDLAIDPSPEEPSSDPDASDPDRDAFVGLWFDVGTIVGLLFLAMVGSVLAVAGVFGLRKLSPARAAAASGRAVFGHFVLGGIGGVLCIVAVQLTVWSPVLGSVRLVGTEIGLGALLVGGFHGGLTATGLRMGLGTVGAWPTRRVIGETTVPVRVRFTDDEGESLPGEQRVEVRRAGDGSLVERTALAGTTTEVELPAGEYAIAGLAAERETDAVSIEIREPTTFRSETRSVHLTVGRPGLQIEVADAETGDPVPAGQVTVTTDREETKAASIEGGTVTTPLPVATGTVTAVVSAEGYDDAELDVPIEEELTTVDVALEPASGTLTVSALISGHPIEGATVAIEPAEVEEDDGGDTNGDGQATPDGGESDARRSDAGESAVGSGGVANGDRQSTPDVGVRTTEVTTGEDGRANAELPTGTYRARLLLDGPNAALFAVSDGRATVESDAEVEISVYGRFDWMPDDAVERRAAGLRNTIQSVADEATTDPTIPLYFAGVTDALLDCVAALPESGHAFATSAQDPDEVAVATVTAAEAALEAVGQAMQADGVRAVLASGGEPVRIAPDLDAAPEDLLAYLERDLAIASVEARAHEVGILVDEEAETLRSVAPARATIRKAVEIVPEGESTTRATAREFAAILLLDAVEQGLTNSQFRARLNGSA